MKQFSVKQVISYCIEAGHAKARGSVFDVEEEEDVDKPQNAVKGTPAPVTSANVGLL